MFGKLRPYLAKCIIAPYDAYCTGELLVISSFNGDMRFLRSVLLHDQCLMLINSATYGAKMPRVNSETILNIEMPYPPYNEQVQIADYIERISIEKEKVIHNIEARIAALKELKVRLISDVVTGKIDIRGIEVPEYEYVAEDVPNSETMEAIAEVAEMQAHPENYRSYGTFQELLDDVTADSPSR